MADRTPDPTIGRTIPAGLDAETSDRGGDDGQAPGGGLTSMRRCSRCHEYVPLRYQFCGHCGFNLISGPGRELAYRDPLIGIVVGERYRLLSRIGIGGMGSVYQAEHVRMGKVVAMKLLHGDLSRDEAMVRRFTREARAVSKLTSNHTVSVFDYGESEGFIYLVMEYLKGQDLGQFLRTYGPVDLPRASLILRQISESLSEAHQHGIIHRDLKPENIFMCSQPGSPEEICIKILDFGLAKLRVTREDSLVRTAQGSLIGTPYYMSPEQISGAEVDVRSDVYGLGALTFKLITDHPPYHHDNPAAVLGMHLSAPIPRASRYGSELEPVDPVLVKALSKTPSGRYPTVAELIEDFVRAVEKPNSITASQPLPKLDLGEVAYEDLSTREDFLRFETRLKIRRIVANVVLIALLIAGGGLFWWGVLSPALVDHQTELEPNDSVQQATPLSLESRIEGHIDMPAVGQWGDMDFYRVENTIGQPVMVQIEVTGVPGLDLVLKTYSPDSPEPLVTVNSGGMGREEQIANLPFPGRYLYVQVREYWIEGQPANYNLSDGYTLWVHARNALRNEEQEPNDGPSRALRVHSAQAYAGMIGWAGDLDVYRAPGTRQGGAMIEVVLTRTDGLDLELRFYHENSRDWLRWNRSGEGGDERARFFADISHPNALYIEVAAVDPESFSTTNHYRLETDYRPVLPEVWELPPDLARHLEATEDRP